MRLFENANYTIIAHRRVGYLLSVTLLIISVGAVLVKGFQYGIDFSGGTEIVVEVDIAVPITEIRELLMEQLGENVMVRNYGSELELQVRTGIPNHVELGEIIERVFKSHLPENTIRIIKMDAIGPTFAQDMRDAAFMATLFSVLVIAGYIFIRFRKFSFSFVVLATLVHDVLIILGIFTLFNGILPFNMDIDQNLIAAFLTIIGYSLNDTIVVFDRIRENIQLQKVKAWDEIVNTSLNQTLSRTVVTSLTTLFAVAVLFIFGGEVLKGFSFAILTGVILGTYSTIFISCPLLVDIIKTVPGESDEESSSLRGDTNRLAA